MRGPGSFGGKPFVVAILGIDCRIMIVKKKRFATLENCSFKNNCEKETVQQASLLKSCCSAHWEKCPNCIL
jgi:hypothetical protein